MTSDDVANNLYMVTTDNITSYCLSLMIEGNDVVAVIDSGSSVNLMDMTSFQSFVNMYDLAPECY